MSTVPNLLFNIFDKVKKKGPNFIEQIIDGDIARGFKNKDLRFRFPPEPNGFLHIGHLKAICLNFNLGENICSVGKRARCTHVLPVQYHPGYYSCIHSPAGMYE